MIKFPLALLFIVTSTSVIGQHIEYRDKPKPSPPAPLVKKDTTVVYHEWPDKCPALTGAVPVLTNYVPHDIMIKVREVYEGHLYSITSIIVEGGKTEYKLKVCVKGQIAYHYANEKGEIVRTE